MQWGLRGLLRLESHNYLCTNYLGISYFIQNSIVCSSAKSHTPKILFFLSLNLSLVAKSYPTLCNPMDCSMPDKNTGMGCHFLLQRIFPTQESNLHLLHWQGDSLPLSQMGSPYRRLDTDKIVGRNGGVGSRCTCRYNSCVILLANQRKFLPNRHNSSHLTDERN